MTPYLRIFKMAALERLQYRIDFLSHIASQMIYWIVFVLLWNLVYASGGHIGDYSRSEMIVYSTLAALFYLLVSAWEVGWSTLSDIHEGGLVNALVRPFSYICYHLAKMLGEHVVELMTMIPILVAALAVPAIRLHLPSSLEQWFAFFVFLCGAFLFSFLLSYLAALMFFMIGHSWGLLITVYTLTSLLGGSVVPLNALPSWLQTITRYLPFQYDFYIPMRVMMGRIEGVELWWSMLGLLAWLSIMMILITWAWKRGLRKYEGFGI